MLISLLFFAHSAVAQGNISGRVHDAESGDPLIGVNVIVPGTAQGTATDPDGSYTISGLSTGSYNIKVSYIGYETKLFTGIEVADGETTELNVELSPAVLSTDEEVVVVGEAPLIDVEEARTQMSVTSEQIEAAPVADVQGVIASQVGVMQSPSGLHIRGGRAEETGFFVDGVSAKDPLAGTGFGLDLGSNAFSEVSITTGGVGVEYGDVTSGVVNVQTRDGSNEFTGFFSHQRDNFGFNSDWRSNFNEERYAMNLGGPIVRDHLFFFVSGQVQLSDGFTRFTYNPDSLRSSLISSDFFMPRTGNRWSGLFKTTWRINPSMKLQGAYQRSLTINQNTRMLQVTGNEEVINPGFQYAFQLQPEMANTFAHDNILGYLKWTHVLNDRSFYDVQVSRLFTRLRADANGRDWRPENVTSQLDPESIVTYPADLFVGPDGEPIDPDVQYVLPGPGFYNNEGLSTLFHDHFAEEWTLQTTYTRFSSSKNNRLLIGVDMKFNDYQWIDIIRPWVGAPVGQGEDVTQTNRLGESSDVWRVKPRRGALFASQQIRYQGLIANVGGRLEYWAPGKYVDDLIENPEAPILKGVRQDYKESTVNLLGLRYKLRFLPKVRVSFPIRENQVLFFNYGHSTRLPHPTFVYAGLNPFYQDRSFFADLGNPNLDPEVDISYEIGLRNQLTSNDALNVTAFWRDKYDFITIQDVVIEDQTGRQTLRAFRVNGDFARVRGIEASYIKRIGRWFQGEISASFSKATGLSSTNDDAIADFLADGNIEDTYETPLAWDRPLDIKGSILFRHDEEDPLLGIPGLNHFRIYLSSTFRSGRRYTPVEFVGREVSPFTGERTWRPIYEYLSDPSEQYSELGDPWWWFDLSVQRDFRIAGANLQASLEIENLFNQLNDVIVNPVTGSAYPTVDPDETNFADLRGNENYDLPSNFRDPRYVDPSTTGLPPFNPARYLPQRHIRLGMSYRF